MGETRRHWIVALLCTLGLVAGCGGTVAPTTPNASSQTTATVAGSAFLFSTVVPSTATVGPPTATAAPAPSAAPPTSTRPPPTETEIAATPTPLPVALAETPEPVITPQPTLPPATATPAPVPTRPRPSATRVPVVPTPTATPAGVTFLAVKGAKPGQTASVSVQAAPGATCSIAFSTAHGTDSVPAGLVPKTADSQGRISWSWLIGTGTTPGTGAVIVTCGKASAFTNITIG